MRKKRKEIVRIKEDGGKGTKKRNYEELERRERKQFEPKKTVEKKLKNISMKSQEEE